ncbi:MAG: chemotaxis protein CheW [Burkholderiaceae bacterium]|nr:chemotaxis protein CheW [Burkholderiaceae bacterium]
MTAPDDLVFHMHRVQAAERDLHDLGMLWQMIESSASISCPNDVGAILPTLVRTRERFNDLQQRLIEQMVTEQRASLGEDLSATAQCAVDTLVRNLYERTADVGFLATDDVVRQFCHGTAEAQQADRASMVQRLREYQSKYTVYDDVILLSPAGAVLARLDEHSSLEISTDPLVKDALAASTYVERFGPSDLGRNDASALLYAHRINSPDGRSAGVLVLRFRFEDEMRRIFNGDDGLVPQEIALVLLDKAGRVIATSDQGHIPNDVVLPPIASEQVSRTYFAGREYLAVNCASHGYQGYSGPAWRAQAMVSLLTAFRTRDDGAPPADNIPLDSPELIAIDAEAQAINRELRQAVWNGRLMTSTQNGDQARLKAVLTQVNTAGTRTRSRVETAIKDLYSTAISRMRIQAGQLARLATDLMDRNLYERANDCRWWALSPALQRMLATPDDPATTPALNGLLDQVNDLYTVYSRLIAFDMQGIVRGVSRAEGSADLVGSTVDGRWLGSVRALRGSQNYAVSPFEATSAHEHGPTYVFLSIVKDGSDNNRPLGGLAIVFHAAREFRTMLNDILGERAGFAAFFDTSGTVLAATGDAAIESAAVDPKAGIAVLEHAGAHYACARVRAGGYREFKKGDGYDNGVHAVVALRLGSNERRQTALSDKQIISGPLRDRAQALEAAVFQVGSMRCALPVSALMEAISQKGLVRTPNADGVTLGLLEAKSAQGPQLVRVMCARRLFNIPYPARSTDGIVLILRSPNRPGMPALGLRVDDVLAVVEFDRDDLQETPLGLKSFAPWVAGMLRREMSTAEGNEPVLVQWLDVDWFTSQGPTDTTEARTLDKPLLLAEVQEARAAPVTQLQ